MSNRPDSESGSKAGGGQTLGQAKTHFLEAFAHGLFPKKLAEDALTFPDELFDHTVNVAITKGFKWKKGEPATDFALEVVQEIAAQAQGHAAGDEVDAATLKAFEKELIRFWKKTCELRRAIFCVLYDSDGNYTGP